jgi:CheY-like chemotaxis protein
MADDTYVLVVDDDEDTRVLLSTILTRNHYKPLVAENAEKARSVLAGNVGKISAILLDITMPTEDGLSFARAIRKQTAWRKVPIIAVTASVFDTEGTNVIKAGCNAHLTKPIFARDLIDILKLYAAVSP